MALVLGTLELTGPEMDQLYCLLVDTQPFRRLIPLVDAPRTLKWTLRGDRFRVLAKRNKLLLFTLVRRFKRRKHT